MAAQSRSIVKPGLCHGSCERVCASCRGFTSQQRPAEAENRRAEFAWRSREGGLNAVRNGPFLLKGTLKELARSRRSDVMSRYSMSFGFPTVQRDLGVLSASAEAKAISISQGRETAIVPCTENGFVKLKGLAAAPFPPHFC